MLGNHYTLGKKWTPKQCEEHKLRMNKPDEIEKRRVGSLGNKYHLGKTGYRHTDEAKLRIGQVNLGRERPDVPATWRRLLEQPGYREMLGMKQRETWKNAGIAKRRHDGLRVPTWPEVRVADVLWQDFLIPGRFEYNGQADADVSVDGCIPDFVWKEKKLVIEVHGGFYHQHFRRFDERRSTKLKLYQDAGYRVLEIWDDELYDDFDPEIVSAKIHGLINGGS
jgi:very-short-patch-repair endonuclease